MNKLKANITCLTEAEERHARYSEHEDGPEVAQKKDVEIAEARSEEKKLMVKPGGGL